MYGSGKPDAGAGAAGAPRLGVKRRQHSIGADARLDLRPRRRPVARRQVLVLAIEQQLDGGPGLPGELRADDALRVGSELAAEPAAHVLGDDADVGLRDVQRRGKLLARAVDGLRGRPGGQLVAVPLADTPVRLERHVRLHLRRVAGLDDMRRGLEARVEIASLFGVARLDVAVLEHLRSALAQRQRFGRDVRQHLVLHLDQPQRVVGLLLGGRGERRDFLALEHDLGAGLEHGHDGLHARGLLRDRQVDRDDTGVRVRRPQDASVKTAWTIDVVGVPGLSGHLDRAVQALNALADQCRLGRPRILLVQLRLRRRVDLGNLRVLSHGAPPSC